jgi:hypothetical protein
MRNGAPRRWSTTTEQNSKRFLAALLDLLIFEFNINLLAMSAKKSSG